MSLGNQLVLHWVVGQKQYSCWRVLWVPKAHEWACWKGRKPTTWYLMPHKKQLGKQGCNCQFCNHKIFNPRKSRLVKLSPFNSVLVQLHSVLHYICCEMSFVIYLLWFVILFVVSYLYSIILLCYFEFVSIFCSFCSFCFIWLFDIGHSVLFLSWYWKWVPGISILITPTIRQVNKHHTSRPAPAFVLV